MDAPHWPSMVLNFQRSRGRKRNKAEALRSKGNAETSKKGRRMEALWLSMKLAACVATILLALGMPVAYWLAYSNWRGKFLLESVVALPLVLPPTVLGFYALVAMGPRGPLGKLWIALFGHGLAFTFGGLILASVLYSFPFAVQPLVASFEGVDRRLLDASAVLGAGAFRTFWQVILPLSLPGAEQPRSLFFCPRCFHRSSSRHHDSVWSFRRRQIHIA